MYRFALGLAIVSACAHGQLLISGNENKVVLTSGTPKFVTGAKPDSVSILDFSSSPPSVRHIEGVPNSVIGPPSNVAISPDGVIALVADSIQQDPADPVKYVPASTIRVLDLTADPPRVIQEIESGKQPSGLSISRDGRFALVADRADGTVSFLAIDGKTVTRKGAVEVCKPEEDIADVSITPDGRRALASVCKGGYLALLEINGEKLTLDKRKISTCGNPYRVAITPDGALAVTAGAGLGGVPDIDAITVVDLKQEPPRTTDYIPIGSGPESLEISPDGNLLAAVLIGGSNLPKGEPFHEDGGKLVILARRGNTFEVAQVLTTGPIPEGVAFADGGKKIVVGCHPARTLWVYDVDGATVRDSRVRIEVPGMAASLRAAEAVAR